MLNTICTGVNKLKQAFVILFALVALTMQPNVAIAQTASNALDFIYIDEPTLLLGDSQHIAFALSDEDRTITEAVLTYSINGKTKTTHASSLAGNAALFEFEVAESGTYQLDKLTCKSNNKTQSIDLVNGFSNTCTFSVSEKTDEASTLRSTPEVTDAGSSFYYLDETGASSSIQTLESTLDQLAIGSPKIGSRSLTTDGQLVIALDPGHGGSDPGTCANGLQEKDLNLKIALYCKAALERYPGVKVVMIRNTDTTVKGLDNRVNYAVSNGADVLISFHINSASAGASGAEVWYPNDSSWKYDEAHVQGGQLAQIILDKLTDLGLTDRGIKTRDWADSHYADGSVADYYGILRYARQQGIPGIIVEHAFITNSADASKLAQDSWLKAMGEADAAGIAETYGLRTNGSWTQLADGSWQYSIDGVVQTGWYMVYGIWYWSDSNGIMATGWRTINGNTYYLDPTTPKAGAMRRGWAQIDGKWYYFSPASGAMVTGWKLIDGTWYYFDGYGAMLTGWQLVGGSWYYMDASGAMRTGWILDGPTWYYLDPSGRMTTGWQLVGGSWYYMDGSGAMRTGTAWDGSAWSSFDASGRWLGYLSGWQLIDGTWYWLDAGVPAKGWRLLGGSWYLLDSGSGAMLTGWQQVGSSWYYMNNSGAMLTGWQLIDGSYHYFDGSGAWNPSSSQPLQPIMSAVNSPSDSMVQSMAAVYNSTGHVYPSTDLASGGASSIEEFCTILVQEAADEGINPYLLFCQVMKETAWLQFGGQVSIGQFNFGGLGAVDGGGQGASFPDVRTGLRAQVQHLKAYAVSGLTESGLAHPCVDPRFKYVSKGSAQYIQWLGIQENPNHTGWASAPQYGISIVQMMEQYF